MKRFTPLNLAAALVVTALVAAAVAAGNGADASPPAATQPTAGSFRQTLAAKLGERLHKSPDAVLAAMKTAAKARHAGATRADRLGRRADRLAARLKRLQARAKTAQARAAKRAAGKAGAAGKASGARNAGAAGNAGSAKAARRAQRAARRTQAARKAYAAREAWAAALAAPLGVSAGDVTAALRALVAERLDSLVADGWLTAGRRDALLACYDDAGKCQGAGRGLGPAFLRAGL